MNKSVHEKQEFEEYRKNGEHTCTRRGWILNEQVKGLDPFPWYEQMRRTQPIFEDKENNIWHIFRYDDVQRILTDNVTFSSEVFQRLMTPEERAQAPEPSILSLDPPRHRQLRSLISQAFTPRTIARLEPRVSDIVNDHLDSVISKGHMDIIDDLSYPLPMIVIAELLGIPSEDREKFKQWSDQIIKFDGDVSRQAAREMRSYLKQVITQRRQQPREDLISELLAAQIDGKHLNEEEVVSFSGLLLIAGNETTTHLISNAFICFDEHPDTMEQIKDDPSLIPSAIEEVLRYRSPVQHLTRITNKSVKIGDQEIGEGKVLLCWLGSANRDEEQFPHPNVFDIHRTPNRHLAFGQGIHFCLGAPLSRLEAKVALTIMLQRLSNIRVDRQVPLQRIDAIPTFFAVKKLPLTFTRAESKFAR